MKTRDFTVMLVDDDKVNTKALRQIIGAEYNVIVAESGEIALEQIPVVMPDIILLDIVMPGMDGFEVLRNIKNAQRTAGIPVIMITGMNSIEMEEKAFNLGAVDFITKPYYEVIVKARVSAQLKMVSQMRLIEKFGFMDPLTNIPNRRYFENRMSAEYGRAKREKSCLGLLMIDIDKFKDYNDTFGHQAGDTLLIKVAKSIEDSLWRPADEVFRWGGEEFIAILPGTDLLGCSTVAERVRVGVEALQVKRSHEGDEVATISIGVYSGVPTASDTQKTFIERADKAMYRAKSTGRNRVCHEY